MKQRKRKFGLPIGKLIRRKPAPERKPAEKREEEKDAEEIDPGSKIVMQMKELI